MSNSPDTNVIDRPAATGGRRRLNRFSRVTTCEVCGGRAFWPHRHCYQCLREERVTYTTPIQRVGRLPQGARRTRRPDAARMAYREAFGSLD